MAKTKIIDGKKFFLKNESTDLSLIKKEQKDLHDFGFITKTLSENGKYQIWFRSKESKLLVKPKEASLLIETIMNDMEKIKKLRLHKSYSFKTFKYKKDKDKMNKIWNLRNNLIDELNNLRIRLLKTTK